MNKERLNNNQPEVTFNTDPFEVASNLKNARLITSKGEVIIRSVQPYTQEENKKPQYKMIIEAEAGKLLGVPYARSKGILPIISTKDGSCVLIRTIQKGEKTTKNLKEIAEILGLQKGETQQLEIKRNMAGQVEIYQGK